MCTALHWTNNHSYFGRNLDLDYDFGQEIIIMPQNYEITYKYQPANAKHYATIGMGVIMDHYPLYSEAVNDQGLAMAGLNFPTFAEFTPNPMEGKLNLTPYELILWSLASFSTVQELKEAYAKLNLVNTPFKDNVPVAPLHWLIADKKESMVLEFTATGLHLYDNPVGVLTNNPEFPFHCTNLHNYLPLTNENRTNTLCPSLDLKILSQGNGSLGLPGDNSAASRFIRAVFHKAHALEEDFNPVDFFHLLDSVKMVKGSVKTPLGYEYTRYSCCMDQENITYYYKTYNNPNLNSIKLTSNNSLGTKLKTYPLTSLNF